VVNWTFSHIRHATKILSKCQGPKSMGTLLRAEISPNDFKAQSQCLTGTGALIFSFHYSIRIWSHLPSNQCLFSLWSIWPFNGACIKYWSRPRQAIQSLIKYALKHQRTHFLLPARCGTVNNIQHCGHTTLYSFMVHFIWFLLLWTKIE